MSELDDATKAIINRYQRHADWLFNSRYSGWGKRGFLSDYSNLIGGLGRGDIAIVPRPIAPDVLKEAATTFIHVNKRSESLDHQFLKHLGWTIMRKHGCRDAEFEADVQGGRADVLSVKGKWQIECGNTRISSFFFMASIGWRWSILPFHGDLHSVIHHRKPRRICLFDMYAAKPYLDWLEQDRLDRMKRAANCLNF